jgi:hypothetical protein
MGEETRKILEMLREGKIGTEEAEKLLAVVAPESASAGGSAEGRTDSAGTAGGQAKKYLRIQVEPEPGVEHGDRVNIRVPMKLIRAGLKLASFLPKDAQTQVDKALHDKGMEFNLSQLKPEDLEELVSNLDELTVDVEGKEKVRIYAE